MFQFKIFDLITYSDFIFTIFYRFIFRPKTAPFAKFFNIFFSLLWCSSFRRQRNQLLNFVDNRGLKIYFLPFLWILISNTLWKASDQSTQKIKKWLKLVKTIKWIKTHWKSNTLWKASDESTQKIKKLLKLLKTQKNESKLTEKQNIYGKKLFLLRNSLDSPQKMVSLFNPVLLYDFLKKFSVSC